MFRPLYWTSLATFGIRVTYVNEEYTAILVTKEIVKNNALYLSVNVFPSTKVLIRHFRNQKETGTSLFLFFGNNFWECYWGHGKNLANSNLVPRSHSVLHVGDLGTRFGQ